MNKIFSGFDWNSYGGLYAVKILSTRVYLKATYEINGLYQKMKYVFLDGGKLFKNIEHKKSYEYLFYFFLFRLINLISKN